MEKNMPCLERHGSWLRWGTILGGVFLAMSFLLETGTIMTIPLLWEYLPGPDIGVLVWFHACILFLAILAFTLALYKGPQKDWGQARTALTYLYALLGIFLIIVPFSFFLGAPLKNIPPLPYSGVALLWVSAKSALYILFPLVVIPFLLHNRLSVLAPALMVYIVLCLIPYPAPNNPAHFEWGRATFGNAWSSAQTTADTSGVFVWGKTMFSLMLAAVILTSLNGYFRISDGTLRTGLLVTLIAAIPIFLFFLPFSGSVSSGPLHAESDEQYEEVYADVTSDQNQQDDIVVVHHGYQTIRHYPSNNQKLLSILLATLIYALAWQRRKRESIPTNNTSAASATELPAAAES